MESAAFISDANILIDIEEGGLTKELFELPYCFMTPDVLFEEELQKRHAHLLSYGLKKQSLRPQYVEYLFELIAQHRRPSRNDLFALSLSLQEGATLLTGDKPLREVARQQKIPFHGSIWLVARMVEAKIIPVEGAADAFERMQRAGSRLPEAQVKRELAKLS